MSIASETLRAAYDLINQPRDFEVGDFVTWKSPRLKNGLHPVNCNDCAVVVQFAFDTPIRGSDIVSTNHYCDYKDMIIGIIDEDGEYSEILAPSRRMKKFVE